ncbi:Hydroxyacylglutathione hydrolase, mitochondrial [Strongyloides ratti]|uniref:hydroxyacylglutathione hydrolase n=1 Tax=Strongyloides ratti TaxID=34506 RepID=A0A090KWY0_STRRB|nr:Hydroxyacylglutathione hydrolase, mitochondrial [Strongyloides ratti]CEF61936.1 Hydroxyacylglutathione hydrolase, mitochondrial [Strongyloides ratti]
MLNSLIMVSRQLMKIVPIPQLSDNFAYLIICQKTFHAAAVDPIEYSDIAKAVKENNVSKLDGVLVTHHHWDHSSGTKSFADKNVPLHTTIYGGGDKISYVNKIVKDGDEINIGSIKIKCLSTPCHTKDHICYYATTSNNEEKAVFTGDTLFISGCGRFFEGSPEEMNVALNEKLGSLPNDTMVYCGHEYTVKNLQFALSLEPENNDIRKKLEETSLNISKGIHSIPSTIEKEKKYNPFMRVSSEEMKKATNEVNPINIMKKLRQLKDAF